MQLQECLWYVDGHHHTFADCYHPIPSLFDGFTGYNTPELSKHRKRSHTNLNADTLKSHVGNLKNFLLCPWMKKQGWATIRTTTEGLAEAMESYAVELFEKNRAVQKQHKTRLEVASDDLAFTVIHAKDDHPIILNGIVGELQKRGNYAPVFVISPQLTGVSGSGGSRILERVVLNKYGVQSAPRNCETTPTSGLNPPVSCVYVHFALH